MSNEFCHVARHSGAPEHEVMLQGLRVPSYLSTSPLSRVTLYFISHDASARLRQRMFSVIGWLTLIPKSRPLTTCESWLVNEDCRNPSSGSAFGKFGSGVPGMAVKPGTVTTPLLA